MKFCTVALLNGTFLVYSIVSIHPQKQAGKKTISISEVGILKLNIPDFEVISYIFTIEIDHITHY